MKENIPLYDLPLTLKDDIPPGLGYMLSSIADTEIMELDHPGDFESLRNVPELVELVPADLRIVVLLDQSLQGTRRCLRN